MTRPNKRRTNAQRCRQVRRVGLCNVYELLEIETDQAQCVAEDDVTSNTTPV